MTGRLRGLSIDNWRECNADGPCLYTFIKSQVGHIDISLVSPNDGVCCYAALCTTEYAFYDILLSRTVSSAFAMTRSGERVSMRNILPLPYVPHREANTLNEKYKVDAEWFFPLSVIKNQLSEAVFRKNLNAINRIISKNYYQKRGQEIKQPQPLIAFTAHSPESVAHTVFSKGTYELILFALKAFKIKACHINRLRLGIRALHPSEISAERGEFTILGELIANHGLAFKGKVIDANLKFYRSFNHIISALQRGNNTILQQAIEFSFRQLKWSWEDVVREDGATPIQLAISEGRDDLLETLLLARAPVNGSGWCDLSPLQFAVDLESSERIVTLLLQHKADPNGKL